MPALRFNELPLSRPGADQCGDSKNMASCPSDCCVGFIPNTMFAFVALSSTIVATCDSPLADESCDCDRECKMPY